MNWKWIALLLVVCSCSLCLTQEAQQGYGRNDRIKLLVKDMTPQLAKQLHARICAHGPTRFCGSLLIVGKTVQVKNVTIPKDAKPGEYDLWLEYDGGMTDLEHHFSVFPRP